MMKSSSAFSAASTLIVMHMACTVAHRPKASDSSERGIRTIAVKGVLSFRTSALRPDDGDKPIYFVDSKEIDLTELIESMPLLDFRDASRAAIRTPKRLATDKLTNEEGTLIERVSIVEQSDSRAVVEVYWHNQALAAGIHQIELGYRSGRWIVVRVESIAVS